MIFSIFLDWKSKMADLNEQDLLDYDEEEQEVKDIKAKKDVKVNIPPILVAPESKHYF